MPDVPGKLVLPSDVKLQFRRAQTVDPQFEAAIRSTCEANREILACYLLDARRPETGEMVLIIAVTLDDEAAQMDSVGLQFQAMLRQFPTQASKTFIVSSVSFADKYAGTEFYVREAPPTGAMNVIRTYTHLHKAHLDRSLLEAHGIPVELRDEMNLQMDWSGGIAAGGVRLAVPEQHTETALDLLGRQTGEARKQIQEHDKHLKMSVLRFVAIVAAFSFLVFALKGFRLNMIGASIGAGMAAAIMMSIIHLVLKKKD